MASFVVGDAAFSVAEFNPFLNSRPKFKAVKEIDCMINQWEVVIPSEAADLNVHRYTEVYAEFYKKVTPANSSKVSRRSVGKPTFFL